MAVINRAAQGIYWVEGPVTKVASTSTVAALAAVASELYAENNRLVASESAHHINDSCFGTVTWIAARLDPTTPLSEKTLPFDHQLVKEGLGNTI